MTRMASRALRVVMSRSLLLWLLAAGTRAKALPCDVGQWEVKAPTRTSQRVCEDCPAGYRCPDRKAKLPCTDCAPCQSITVSGQTAYQPQNDAMGEYELLPGSTGSGKGAYRFGGYFLYFTHLQKPARAPAWCISAELGAPRCELYLRHYDAAAGTALTTRSSGTWEVLVDEGAKADVGRYVAAMNVHAVCTSRALTWARIHAAREETRVVGDNAEGQFGDEATHLRDNGVGNSRSRRVVILASCAAVTVVIGSWLSLSQTVAAATELVRHKGAAGGTSGYASGVGPGTSPGFAGVAPDACDSLTLPPSEGGGTERDAAAREEVRTLLSTV